MVMLVPLMILALLSVVGGLVGIGNRFEHFLEPVFGSGMATEAAGEAASHGTELLLMGVSVTVALLGLILAWVLYVSKPYLPQKIADSLGSFYEAVLNKYYIDELYAKLFVKPLVDGSTLILWKGVDREVIDDTVNDAAEGARKVSDEVRHMQSGNLRSYAGWIAAGSALVIAYMIWLGVGR
jgi:NADH-quinone oxidoreductase subunit L